MSLTSVFVLNQLHFQFLGEDSVKPVKQDSI